MQKKSKFLNNLKYVKGNWGLYLMLVPCIAALVVFNYVPYYGLTLAFKEYSILDGIWGSPWSGWDNFKELFGDPYFVKVMLNTVKLSVINLAVSFPIPIILAIAINEIGRIKLKKTVQTLIYLPYFISWVIVAGMINTLFSKNGTINELFNKLFGTTIPFYSNGSWFVFLLVLSNIWKGAGWGTVIYFAAIANISPELYEAALVDGANRFQRIRHITLPGLKPAITITLILSLSGLMQGNFDQIVNMYNQLVYDKADIIQTYIYRIGIFDGKYGLSTALSLFESLVGFVLIVSVNFLVKKTTGDGLW